MKKIVLFFIISTTLPLFAVEIAPPIAYQVKFAIETSNHNLLEDIKKNNPSFNFNAIYFFMDGASISGTKSLLDYSREMIETSHKNLSDAQEAEKTFLFIKSWNAKGKKAIFKI